METVLQVRTNCADVANTVLKIGKKRSLVDGILTVTGASDIFTQDIEDLPEELLDKKEHNKAQEAPPKQEQREAWIPPDESQPETATEPEYISDPQRKRLYAISRGAGMNDNQIRAELEQMGFKSSKDIKKADYDDIVMHFENWRP